MTPVNGLGDPAPTGWKQRRWFPVLLIVGGSLCLVSGVAIFVIVVISGVLSGRVVDAPATVAIGAHVGDYYVFQQVGTASESFGISVSSRGLTTLDRGQVVVTAPDGGHIPTWSGDGSETITKDSVIYADAVGFHVSSSGIYRVTIAATSPDSMLVAPSIGDSLESGAPWLILFAPGIGGVASGVTLLILGQRRRRKFVATPLVAYQPWSTAPVEVLPGSAPPGWYPDPSGARSWRWWDGRSWTSHTAPR